MFESAELTHVLDKPTFKEEEPKLRAALLAAQAEAVERKSFPVIMLVAGVDGAGKGRAIQRLYEWLDPHHLRTHAYGEPNEMERARPRMWRYWRDLPPKGEFGIVFGSWYNQPLKDRVLEVIDDDAFEHELEAINRFELMLANEGALILKFWFHLSREQQKRRLKTIKALPGGGRHVLEEWSNIRRHGRTVTDGQKMARRTSTGHAPWVVIPSGNGHYRDIAMGRTILEALQKRLQVEIGPAIAPAPAVIASPDRKTVLDALDLSRMVSDRAYHKTLSASQNRLAELVDSSSFQDRALVMVFEGSDAAGKGGTIRRVTAALDPRRFGVHPIGAPTDEERAQPYLWRFWRRIPPLGRIAAFDRSWYGRVLVERVEELCDEAEWLRAYNEINDFERQLAASGVVVVKFWLAISPEEQLRRFKEREATAFKQYKITPDDWRNRQKWEQYKYAVGDMIDRTSTQSAPWTLIESEDKHFARLKVLRTICDRVEAAL
jgi:AMP-polyphosphate phosphotransferase